MREKELPEGWEEVDFKEVITYKKGKKPKTLEFQEFEDSAPYLDIKALEYGEYRKYADIKSSNMVNDSSVAIVWDGARSGWVSKVDYGALGSTIAALTPKFIDVDYVYYFLKSNFKYLNTNTRGTGIPHVDPETLWNLQFPLPPLAEQKRIVAKLDEAFQHMDTLKAKLARIPELLKTFRQSVLTQAVTGKLIDSNGYDTNQLASYLSDIKYGTSQKSEYGIAGVPVLRIPNIKDREIDATDLKFSSLEEKEFEKLSLKEGDLLIIRSNGSLSIVGLSSIIRKEHIGFAYAGYLIRLRTKQEMNPEFLNFIFGSNFLRTQITEKARSTSGVNNINTDEIKSLEIPVPPLEEQKEIVKKVEALFTAADALEAHYQKLKLKIDQLPQALLAKAFRGELVPQDPTDEPATVLLEKIKAAKASTAKAPNGKKPKPSKQTEMLL